MSCLAEAKALGTSFFFSLSQTVITLFDMKSRSSGFSAGHNLAEVVSVHAYLCSETTPLTFVGRASLEYVHDDAQVSQTNILDPLTFRLR